MMTSQMSVPYYGDTMNPDLRNERVGATFKDTDMTQILYGEQYLTRLARLRKMMAHSPSADLKDLWQGGKYDRYLKACERAYDYVRISRQHQLSKEDGDLLMILFGEDFFLALHMIMFLPSLESMADDEQQREWLPLARDFRIFGTYAQTELGHGSNVPGIETTAEFDKKSDQWVLNTPMLTSTKWWPGGLAKSCTHCILMARVVIDGKDFGPHPFFFQVRDLNTHESLPGVSLWDIGSKLGYNGMDNGAMQLANVRIPRRNLLMRYTRVDRDGTYSKVGDQKMLYGAMTYTRMSIIAAAGAHLAKALTIAIRYSAVRRQFALPGGGPQGKGKAEEEEAEFEASTEVDPSISGPHAEREARKAEVDGERAGENVVKREMRREAARALEKEVQVLDYSSQQFILFPLLAAGYGMHFAGKWVRSAYESFMERARGGDFSRLQDIHVTTCALKAHCTQVVADGMEQARRSCGGHGYLLSAGIGGQLQNFTPQVTYEGDFVVLSIQTGRALLKLVAKKMKGKPTNLPPESELTYITTHDPFATHSPSAPGSLLDFSWQLSVFRRRACHLIMTAAKKFADSAGAGRSPLLALDDVKIDMCRVTKAHAAVLVLTKFQQAVEEVERKCSQASTVGPPLRTLCNLYALSEMDSCMGDFVISKALPVGGGLADKILEEMKRLCRELRPNAVSLVDAWQFPDYLLNSALGRYDGRVYEALMDSVRHEPNNTSDVHESYYRSLQYILHPERKQQQGAGMPLRSRL
uniref:Acyl-coenzyme A oxidase n=3 Tax=Chromera velia TaxID=505693 RepID=A0A0G4HS83_9ALVE|eukprot:Cvel_8226.t1-p1 / transcript=Cvel_8226.t1 / gene=Cvel_8226 / organism=Chromera_velia_CCMP2878 / gene_product=Peroxisomal acyl-coenzyme A oxidase 1, putative / transcript_product=Peroxisomal acyl-coenzyme A oxidase 1, putative / location=Cvel_scaffold449:27201-37528(+) / protein_length=753 / sequence_SO=supercontig / SO=protein_coding / is_pseudo=false